MGGGERMGGLWRVFGIRWSVFGAAGRTADAAGKRRGWRGSRQGCPCGALERRWMLFLVLLALGAWSLGCSTTQVTVDLNFPHDRVRKIAVLDFDQDPIEVQVRDKLVWGRAEYRRAGREVADRISQALAQSSLYEVYDRTALRDLMRKKSLDQAALTKELDVAALRGLLGVDAVVVGEVTDFRYTFVCFYQQARAAFSAKCVDLSSGAVIWRLHGSRTRAYADEGRLAARIAADAAHRLKREMEFSALIRKAGQGQ